MGVLCGEGEVSDERMFKWCFSGEDDFSQDTLRKYLIFFLNLRPNKYYILNTDYCCIVYNTCSVYIQYPDALYVCRLGLNGGRYRVIYKNIH